MAWRDRVWRGALGVLAAWYALLPGPCAGEGAEGAEGAEEAEGVALFQQARFEEAEAAFEAVLANPATTVAQVAVAHLYLAALRLVAGDAAAATTHARAAVALDPSAAAPEGAPLRLGELLRDAASGLPRGGLAVEVEAPACPAAGAPVAVRARLAGAPPGLVGSVALRCSCGEASRETEGTGLSEVELTVETGNAGPGDDLGCVAEARSASGAVLRSRSIAVSLCRPAAQPAEAPPQRERRPRTGLWIGLGVGTAVVAVAVAVALGVVLGMRPDTAQLGDVRLEGP